MTESDYYANSTDLIASDGLPVQDDPWGVVTLIFKSCIMFSIMVCAVFGNLLVIVSVFRHHRLRITTNFFVVSLAMADTLVALFAMTFNASYSIAGKWLFGQQVCDFWNSCDVLFSTASIMHLGCISLDRYYAIMKPLEYPTKITAKRVAALIAFVWVSSGLISFIPIFLGWYTTLEHMDWQRNNPDKCEFRVNKPYAIVSSSVSFWIPCVVMLFTYWKIYQEASRQEKWLFKTQVVPGTAVQNHLKNGSDGTTTGPGGHRGSNNDDPESGHSTPTKRSISKMKREHKAAKTLGIIMGAFILCWLPFFLWYVSISMCGEACYCPDVVVEILFWIGYFNSSLNPVIYAYFNKEFREAFKETLRNVFCRCVGHWQCLQEAPRENSNAMNHSSNARTTVINHSQEIGMVNKKQFKDDL